MAFGRTEVVFRAWFFILDFSGKLVYYLQTPYGKDYAGSCAGNIQLYAQKTGGELMKFNVIGRRDFLRYAAAAAAGTVAAGKSGSARSSRQGAKLRKALQSGMLPRELSDEEKFKLASKCGFEGIEGYPMGDLDAARRLGRQARQAGVPIHSIVRGGWDAPFSDPDPKVIDKAFETMETALRSARAQGADTVLLVPAIVTEDVGYKQAYTRSQRHIKKVLPLAEELGVVIAVENVWNKFLLSPLEFARYVDEFESPWLQAYFDIGNVILFGYSQDWIRTLGDRIVKIHLKDFKRKGYKWTNLLEGDVNWPEVRRALDEIGYDGYLTTELRGGDEAYLTDLAGRIDKFFAM
jgi:hexulose-6-phosphate isomerase